LSSGDHQVEQVFGTIAALPQETTHLSDRSKNVGEERLLLQQLGEALPRIRELN
jgi:hypothetical protein